ARGAPLGRPRPRRAVATCGRAAPHDRRAARPHRPARRAAPRRRSAARRPRRRGPRRRLSGLAGTVPQYPLAARGRATAEGRDMSTEDTWAAVHAERRALAEDLAAI